MSSIEQVRHSLAHLLAGAVLEIWPEAKPTIGPVIDNGFYYDFDLPSPISDKDLSKIEQKMREIFKKWDKFEKQEISPEEAGKFFKDNPYKLELIKELAGSKEPITFYKSGDFTDLCRGGHVETAKELKDSAWKLSRVAGAYWRGDEKNKMLTRIYGLAFSTKKELEDYEKQIEEAKKRDHKKLGKELDLFMISEEVGKGLPLWLPKGAFIRHKLEEYMYQKEYEKGYKYVYTPVLTHKRLYEVSGHLDHYRDDMYNPINIEGEDYYLKPMNCPHHHMIYRNKPLSYRDLPLRLAEFGLIHRFERSGVLTGLIRARCFTQNDSHIYCQPDDLKKELRAVLDLFGEVYKDFSIKDYWFRLSLPDFNKKEKYGDIQDEEMWNRASEAARSTLEESGMKYVEGKGEASFYGPKIDVQVRNVLGKEDTIATAQIDFYSPKKFDLFFTNVKGEKEHPVIIHRAIMGSFDRFFAFLLEQTGGNFPLWLSPTQIKIIPVRESHKEYAEKIFRKLQQEGMRAELDSESENLGKKVRRVKVEKIPYWIVVGDKEIETEKVTLESRDRGETSQIEVGKIIGMLREELKNPMHSV